MIDDGRPARNGLPTIRHEGVGVLQVDRAYRSTVDVPGVKSMLRRRRWPMLIAAVVVFAMVVLATLLMPRKYESNATFLVEENVSRAEGPALDILQRLGSVVSRQTEIELIQSRRVLGPVIDSLGLRTRLEIDGEALPASVARRMVRLGPATTPGDYTLNRVSFGQLEVTTAAGTETVVVQPDETFVVSDITLAAAELEQGVPVELSVYPLASAINSVRGKVSAGEVRRDADLFQVTCEGDTPQAAHDLCEEISNAYLRLKLELQRAEASTAAEFLAEQAARVDASLKAAEDSLADYQRRTNAVALMEQASEQVRQGANLWARRETVRNERRAIQSLVTEIEGDDSGSRDYRDLVSFPTFMTQQSQVVPSLVETLVDLETRRSDLTVRRSDQDPEIVALDDRIDEIEGQLRKIAEGYEGSLALEEQSLDQAIASTGATLSRIPVQQAQTVRLERQAHLLADLYTFLQTRLREAELAQAVEMPAIRVVDAAVMPHEPSSPRTLLNVAVGLIVATGFGLMVGFWMEYTDTRLHERRAVEFEAGLPVLTMLPRLSQSAKFAVTAPNGGSIETADSDRETIEVRELALDALQTLVVELRFAADNLGAEPLSAVAVTSAEQGDGKTFTACNLAIARASQGARVLLIDADVRGKGVTRSFRLGPDVPGLVNLAEDEGWKEPAPVEVDLGGGASVWVLPAGFGDPNPAVMVAGDVLASVLDWARPRYDFIVVDTPPLNVLSDAASAATLVDGVLVVVRSGKTDRTGLEYTLERLGRVRATTVGIVLNDVDVPDYYRSYSYTG